MGSRAKLSVRTAIKDGWQVFRCNPWPFAFFALFALVLSSAVDLIPDLPHIPRLISSSLVDLWASVGLIRCAWLGLDGRSIRFGDLIHVNGPEIWRLFSRQLVLALPLSLFSSAVLLLAATTIDARELVQSLYFQLLIADPSSSEASTALITQMQGLAITILSNPIALMVTISGIIVVVYVHVNQAFLGFLAVVQGLGPISTIREGFRTVRSDWWQVLGLLVLQTLILLLGVMACGFGLLAAIPVVACSTASAYRQLFSAGAETGD
jgi:hypothetical protein